MDTKRINAVPDTAGSGAKGKGTACLQWYSRHIFPYIEILITSGLRKIRRRLLCHARGRVVEIGAGAAGNLAHLPATTHSYLATDPSMLMVDKAKQQILRRGKPAFEAWVIRADAAHIPLGNETADTIISLLVLCSVPDPFAALSEIYRVLRPGGRFLFFEHVLAARSSTIRLQNLVNPVWKRLGGGCHLNRETAGYIAQSGFRFEKFRYYRTARMGPSITSNVIEGVAGKKWG
ncbi:MAG: class I SAM-dependent methyltransferase [Desulfosalsimonadaceae bacterium]